MNRVLNYFGQLRLYSFLDLLLALVVSGATGFPLVGAILLHVGFLAFLESQHEHIGTGRRPVFEPVSWAIIATGWSLYNHPSAGTWYIFFSVMYAMKKLSCWGLVSPFARGAQTFVLLCPFTNAHWFLGCAAVAMVIRNLLGDLRDVEQDRGEKLRTWPVVLGVRRDHVFVHLLMTIGTTWLWWSFSSATILIPFGINITQLATYWLTPRPSNKKAADWLRSKVLSHFGRWAER